MNAEAIREDELFEANAHEKLNTIVTMLNFLRECIVHQDLDGNDDILYKQLVQQFATIDVIMDEIDTYIAQFNAVYEKLQSLRAIIMPSFLEVKNSINRRNQHPRNRRHK